MSHPAVRLLVVLALAAGAPAVPARDRPAAAHPAGSVPVVAQPGGGDLADRIDDASYRLEIVVEQYNDIREDLRATRRRALALDRRMAPLRRQIEARRDRVGEFAATAYRSGTINPISSLLYAESAAGVVDGLLLLDHLARQQQRELDGLRADRERYETARGTLARLAAHQEAQRRLLAARQTRILAEIAALERLRGWPPGWPGPRVRPPAVALPLPPAGRAGAVVRFVYAQLGKGYRWAGEGPDAYDCSGLVAAAYRQVGVRLPHNARRQWHAVIPVSRTQLFPGDLVFYYRDIHHVAVYIGGDRVIHAPRHGEPVRVDTVRHAPLYGFGRVGPGPGG